jgi:hypothetical protein
MFLTVAPDFVHSSGAIRLSFPETNADFPLDAFLDSLGTGSVFVPPERQQRGSLDDQPVSQLLFASELPFWLRVRF